MHFVVTVQRSGNFLPPLAAHPVAAVRPAVPAALTMSLALALAVPARDEAAAQVYVRDSVYCVSSLARRRNQRIAYCHLFCSFFILLHLLFRALSPCRAVQLLLLPLYASFNPFDLGFKCKIVGIFLPSLLHPFPPSRCCRCAHP